MDKIGELREVIYGINTTKGIDAVFNSKINTIEVYQVIRQLTKTERQIIETEFSDSELAKLAKHVQETVDYDNDVLARSKELHKEDIKMLIELAEEHFITTVSIFIISGPGATTKVLSQLTRAAMMARAAGSSISGLTDSAIEEAQSIVNSAIEQDRPAHIIDMMSNFLDKFTKDKSLFVEGLVRINNEHNTKEESNNESNDDKS